MGPRGEGSKDLHSLVKVLAETKLAAKARSLGRQMSDKELGVIVNQVRKYLSTSFIRVQSLCLINRLSYLGEGAQAAAGRRIVARQLEEDRRRLLLNLLCLFSSNSPSHNTLVRNSLECDNIEVNHGQ